MKREKLIHGGDWVGFEREYGYEAVDLSANVSPFGVPETVQAAVAAAVAKADRYPDPLCRRLRAAIAKAKGVAAEHILCGNGAADILFRLTLAKKPRRVLVPAPTFAEYRAAAATVGSEVVSYPLKRENDFRLDAGFLDAIDERTDIVFVCEPNNPTGVTDDPALLKDVLRRVEDVGALLVVDECFHDFLAAPERGSMAPYVADHRRLLVLKAFTKMYGMAGIRLGYCFCADEELLAAIAAAGQPWSVSYLAEAAGIAALQDDAYVAKVRAHMAKERPYLREALSALGCDVLPGEANYLLFRSVPDLDAKLRPAGVLIRACANYEGLDNTWFRTAIRTRKESDTLLAAMEKLL